MRIDGTRNLVAPARAARARRFIAQSISFMCTPYGSGLTDEETPLYLDAPRAVRALAEAVASLECQTLHAHEMSGTVLRYGWFYGPGTRSARGNLRIRSNDGIFLDARSSPLRAAHASKGSLNSKLDITTNWRMNRAAKTKEE